MSVGMSSNGFTVWFTGMAGAGKSTLSQALSQRLKRLGMSPEILDAADVAQMLSIGSAATKDERNAEVKRLTWVCRLITRGGGVVFQSAVQSPNREVRDEARRQISRFVEVFVDCPIDQLISRDKTGQYKRALAGELKNLPGITEPYEPPTHPEVLVDTSKMTVDDAVEHLVGQLVALRYVDPGQAGLKSRPKLTAVSKIPLRPPPLEPAPKPVLYKAPPKSAAPAKEEKPAKANAKPAASGKPALKAVPNKPAAKTAPAKKPASAKPAAKDVAKPKSAKLVVAKAPTSSAAKTGKASKPAAKSASKPKPAVKTVARPEAKRAAGGRKR
jgi:adenylyl-sulfate kinase